MTRIIGRVHRILMRRAGVPLWLSMSVAGIRYSSSVTSCKRGYTPVDNSETSKRHGEAQNAVVEHVYRRDQVQLVSCLLQEKVHTSWQQWKNARNKDEAQDEHCG
jgi:hypothetical protein